MRRVAATGLESEWTAPQAMRAYRAFIVRHRRKFQALLGINIAMLGMSIRLKGLLAGLLSQPAAAAGIHAALSGNLRRRAI